MDMYVHNFVIVRTSSIDGENIPCFIGMSGEFQYLQQTRFICNIFYMITCIIYRYAYIFDIYRSLSSRHLP